MARAAPSLALLLLLAGCRHVADALQSVRRPKTEWHEPLTAAEVAQFEKDLDMPIAQWVEENPSLGPSYFMEFGVPRGYLELAVWAGVEEIEDYEEYGKLGYQFMTSPEQGYRGPNNGLHVTLNVNGTNISTHLDSNSFIADDPYCFSLGWLKGQHLDGSLMSNNTAWEALAERECEKIQAEERFPEELHTVRHHVEFNREWPKLCECNVVDGLPPGGLPPEYAVYGGAGGTPCEPVSERDFREHAYRKCLLGFAAAEMSYCYEHGCLLEGNNIGHGADCR